MLSVSFSFIFAVFPLFLFLLSPRSFLDVPMIFSCPGEDHELSSRVNYWVRMVEARSVYAKNTHPHTPQLFLCHLFFYRHYIEFEAVRWVVSALDYETLSGGTCRRKTKVCTCLFLEGSLPLLSYRALLNYYHAYIIVLIFRIWKGVFHLYILLSVPGILLHIRRAVYGERFYPVDQAL